MVHDVRAALPATVVVTEHRAVHNQSAEVTRALAEHGAQAMVTGQLLWAEFGTGRTEFINAGHVWPLLLRDGGLEELTPAVDLPFSIALHTSYQVQSLHLRPGDRLVLISDGMIEPDGHDRVLRRLIEETRQLHAREATRVFTRSVLSASGHDPRDDATVLCLDWPRPD